MQMIPAKRRTLLFALVAILLALVIGYRFFNDAPVVTDASRPTPHVVPADSSTRADVVDTSAVTRAPVGPTEPSVAKKVAPAASRQSALKPTTEPEPTEKPKAEATQPSTCDQLVFRDGNLVDAHVTEVGTTEIRYKKCNRQDGPGYVVLKRDVLSIRYSDGTVDRFTP